MFAHTVLAAALAIAPLFTCTLLLIPYHNHSMPSKRILNEFISFTAAAAASCSRSYTIQDGDICDSISAANNASTYQLAALNPPPSTPRAPTSSLAQISASAWTTARTAKRRTLSLRMIPAMASLACLGSTRRCCTPITLSWTSRAVGICMSER